MEPTRPTTHWSHQKKCNKACLLLKIRMLHIIFFKSYETADIKLTYFQSAVSMQQLMDIENLRLWWFVCLYLMMENDINSCMNSND